MNTIDKERLREICKLGQGADCCRYITAGPDGIRCQKFTSVGRYIDARVLEGTFVARGDNCPGLEGK
jgi:hypothetical protein